MRHLLTTQDSVWRNGGRGSASSRYASSSQRMLEAIASSLGLQASAISSRMWARRATGARARALRRT